MFGVEIRALKTVEYLERKIAEYLCVPEISAHIRGAGGCARASGLLVLDGGDLLLELGLVARAQEILQQHRDAHLPSRPGVAF